MALACSILGTFYVMKRMGSGSTILLLFFGSLSLEALAFYIISIEKPAMIPGMCDRIKRKCLLLLCQRPRGGRDVLSARERLVVLKLRTMRELVVREMGYWPIESMSSTVFIDFYFN